MPDLGFSRFGIFLVHRHYKALFVSLCWSVSRDHELGSYSQHCKIVCDCLQGQPPLFPAKTSTVLRRSLSLVSILRHYSASDHDSKLKKVISMIQTVCDIFRYET
jgi:hypothetical protein